MAKFDPTTQWLRKQMSNATKAVKDLKAGQKIEVGGVDVSEQWIATYERLIARYQRLITVYEKRNRERA
jgi:hypothetical protein